jgi:hypothetical protein
MRCAVSAEMPSPVSYRHANGILFFRDDDCDGAVGRRVA